MANPTTEKPSTPEWDSGANANLQFLCVLENATGAPRDLVGNVPSRYYDGYQGTQTGAAPVVTTATFGGVTSQTTYKFGINSAALLWPGRAWASGTSTTNKTFAITFRHNFPSGKNACQTISAIIGLLTAGSDGNVAGIALNVSVDGVVTWGYYRNFGFFSSGQTLTAGTWYTIALTIGSATNRLFNLYDHGAQSATAQVSSSDSSFGTFVYGANSNSVVLNHNSSGNYNANLVEVYAALLASETWDTGANSRFQSFYQDPAVWARGSYAPGAGTLTAGTASVYEVTASAITVTASRPTSGASAGVYTYQWHRSTAGPTFTPDGTTSLSGKTSLTCVDSTAAANTNYYYKCAQTDGTSTVYTNSATARRANGSLSMGCLGDSLSVASAQPVFALISAAAMGGWRIHSHNRGVGGTFVGTPTASSTTLSWKPGTFVLGATNNGTAGNFTITVTNSGGTQTTGNIAYNASSTTVQTELRNLSNVGSSGVTVISSGGNLGSTFTTFALVFSGAALPTAISTLNVSANSAGLTGGPYFLYSLYRNAVLSWQADAVTITDVYIHLGTNDAGYTSSAATFGSDMSNLVNALLSDGFTRIWLHSPPSRWLGNSDTVDDLVRQYEAQLDSLVNGTTIVRGDASYKRSAIDSPLHDGLHFTIGGFWALGFYQWQAMLDNVLDPIPTPTAVAAAMWSNTDSPVRTLT